MNNKLIVFSGMQPSGSVTIGNYISALRQWVKIQNDYKCLYCIADLHAITVKKNISNIYSSSLDMLAIYLACGIDPKRSIIFMQSHVPEHSQLHWILNNYTYFGELNRMVQFKSKCTSINNCNINVGLFSYPILMASDILLYRSNKVPIGKDQEQHLELSKKIARRFNKTHGNIFNIPKPITPISGGRIMGLLNPKKKMSKSDMNNNNIIVLLDNINIVKKKILNAITDSDIPPIIKYDPINKAGISNLLEILSGLTDTPITTLEKEFKGQMYSSIKYSIINEITYIFLDLQEKYYFFRSDEKKLKNILYEGAFQARNIAKKTLNKVYNSIGFIPS